MRGLSAQRIDMDFNRIINKYYPEENALKRILLVHSRAVADKALQICDAHPELHLDRQFVEEAAMLHDIGIFRCDAPGIECFGTEPYVCHGQIGAEIMRKEGFPRHARVCERHTGAGLTVAEILSQHLPITIPPPPSVNTSAKQEKCSHSTLRTPHSSIYEPFLPETLEEQLICYADKFFSKTRPELEKTVEQAERSLAKFGEEGVRRFQHWHALFA